MRFFSFFRSLSAAVLLVAVLAGCEEEVAAVLGTGQPFTLYGVVSPQLDTQWVRVYPVAPVLEPTPPTPLDARFTSTDLATGEQRVWRDSLIRDPDGNYAHVFWSPFEAAYGRTYRLEVRHPDGTMTHVDAAVPPLTRAEFPPETILTGNVQVPVLIAGGAPHLLKLELLYNVQFQPAGGGIQSAQVTFPYAGRQVQDASGGWTVPIDLSGDYRAIQTEVVRISRQPLDLSYGIKVSNLNLNMIVANAGWAPPGESFDPEVLVQPGILENVENGFGFVGTGYRLRVVFLPTGPALKEAGFLLREGQ